MILLWEIGAYLLRMPRYLATWQTPTGCVITATLQDLPLTPSRHALRSLAVS
jgi:hypothetical protein